MEKQIKNSSCEVGFFLSFSFMLASLAAMFLVLLFLKPERTLFLPHTAGQPFESPLFSGSAKFPDSALATVGSAHRRNGGFANTARSSGASEMTSGASRGAGLSAGSEGGSGGRSEGVPTAGGGSSHDDTQTQKLMGEAIALIDKGEPYKAMAILEKILAEDGKNEQALIELGMIHLIDLQDSQAALPYLERAYQANADNKVVLGELIGIYQETGQTDAGLNFLQDRFEENPNNSTVAAGIGQIYKEQNRIAEAIPYLEKSAENAAPEQADLAYTELGEVYQRSGQLDKALSSFRQAADRVQAKYDNGFYAHDDEMGREELVAAKINVVKTLISQNRQGDAQEVINSLKPLYNGNLGDLAKQIERSNMLFGYNRQ